MGWRTWPLKPSQGFVAYTVMACPPQCKSVRLLWSSRALRPRNKDPGMYKLKRMLLFLVCLYASLALLSVAVFNLPWRLLELCPEAKRDQMISSGIVSATAHPLYRDWAPELRAHSKRAQKHRLHNGHLQCVRGGHPHQRGRRFQRFSRMAQHPPPP